jgi:hypothetical protein
MISGFALITGDVAITFMYRNYKGKVAQRRVRTTSIVWGATEWHPKEGFLLRAYDLDKDEERMFSMHPDSMWDVVPL